MTFTLGGYRISEGTLTIPRVGRPVFIGRLADTDGPGKNTSAELILNDQKWVGKAQWASQEARGWWGVRWVGGNNGIGAEYAGKHYREVTINVFLQAFVQSVKETWGGSDIDANARLKRILIMPGTGAQQLEQVLTAMPSQVWRIRQDGKLYVLKETWPTVNTTVNRLDYDPTTRMLTLEEDFAIQPGTVLTGYAGIERVTHHIGKQLRTEVHFGLG